MRRIVWGILLGIVVSGCNSQTENTTGKGANKAAELDALLHQYWEDHLQLFPIEATGFGDNRYNDRLTITIASSFRDSMSRFYNHYLSAIAAIDTTGLDAERKLSHRIFTYEMQEALEGLKYPEHLMPITQFRGFTLELPQLGSGTGNQPFKTIADYDNWLKRLSYFPAWVDTAIANMRTGIKTGWVLPKALVIKMLPQVHDIVVADPAKSIFHGPLDSLPAGTTPADSARLTAAYTDAILHIVNPTYTKLYDFLKNEYLPASRKSSGVHDIPGGDAYYNYCAHYWTTTTLSPDSIYNIGLAEVNRLEAEMQQVREQTGFKGNLKAFFSYLSDNKQFFPFTTATQVIDSFWGIKKLEEPQLQKLFRNVPKTKFTIRQTEAFRAASASAEYNQGAADGSRPGIFYVPVVDPAKFNCVGMSTLFLHEAIPGHHYQISLQQENKDLPEFRRFLWYGAYGEGWAHYCETLGKELGVYNDPYQYFGHLSDAIHRAIRLVVDVGLHQKGMTREQAIAYMTEHELISEREATAEIERYMSMPGQALSYKIGQMAISSERAKYTAMQGRAFDIRDFHDEVLHYGCLPLSILKEQLANRFGAVSNSEKK